MVGSVSGGNAVVLINAFLKEASARQDLDVSLVKKAQDQEKLQGEAALKLIDAAASVGASGKVDVRV